VSSAKWNEVVDAYNALRSFSVMPEKGFELLLDHSTYYNEYGWSHYNRLYLDGVFGYLLLYKGEHVLTIGFSIMGGKRLLIQQVQAPARKGNRALYRLPHNRVEFVIELFERHFEGYELSLVTGESLVEKTLSQ